MELWKLLVADMAKVPLVKSSIDDAIGMWGSDIPITVLFSNIGKGIACHFELLSVAERKYVFETIEAGMTMGDEASLAAIATGLLEALYLSASNDGRLWKQIDAQLGEKSKGYLSAWNQWQE